MANAGRRHRCSFMKEQRGPNGIRRRRRRRFSRQSAQTSSNPPSPLPTPASSPPHHVITILPKHLCRCLENPPGKSLCINIDWILKFHVLLNSVPKVARNKSACHVPFFFPFFSFFFFSLPAFRRRNKRRDSLRQNETRREYRRD